MINHEFWKDVFEHDPVIINSQVFTVNTGPAGVVKGFEGRTFHIHMNDGREIVTNDLWLRGDLPQEYYQPDNATCDEMTPTVVEIKRDRVILTSSTSL